MDNYEAGVKAGNQYVHADLAVFYIKIENELAVLGNSNGRTVDQNIEQTNLRLGFCATLETEGRARIYADDRNSDYAAATGSQTCAPASARIRRIGISANLRVLIT